MIDIIALSDLHGNLIKDIPSFDLLLIGGDSAPAHDHYYSYQKEWYTTEFTEWVNELPFKNEWSKVILIAGNHDIFLEREPINSPCIYQNIVKPCNGRLIYLRNQEYNFEYFVDNKSKSLKIFGTPWCKIFGNWAFMGDSKKLTKKYSEIPKDCEILLCHDVPFEHNDECLGWKEWNRKLEHIGNSQLRFAIEEKQPKLSLHGHLHSTDHNKGQLNNTITYNVSILNEQYQITYKPLHLQYDGKDFIEIDEIDKNNPYNL